MGKCVDCGFLTVRHRDSRQLIEVEPWVREHGSVPSEVPGSQRHLVIFEIQPICFARAFQFPRTGGDSNHFIAAIGTEKPCGDAFIPWIQGFTPKEHAEMRQAEHIREWQSEREREDRVWREEQERKAEERHKEEMHVVGTKVPMFAGLFGIAGVIVGAVIAAVLQRSG